MTAATSRPPATPRGRNWHVKAYLRALSGMLSAAVISFAVIYSQRGAIDREEMGEPLVVPVEQPVARSTELVVDNPFTFHPDAPLPVAFLEFLVAHLTFWPVLALLLGGLVCTVIVEIRQQRREGPR